MRDQRVERPVKRTSLKPARTKSVPQSPYEHYRSFASRYVDIARTAAGKTGTISVLWLTAVAICWWSIESEVTAQTEMVTAAANSYREAAKRYSEATDRLKPESAKSEAESKQKDEELAAAEKQLKDAASSLDAAKSRTVEFKLPTFPSFRVVTRIAPAILSAIILLLALYLTFMRNRTFRYLAQALRILRFKLEDPMDKIGEILGPRNWWVAPLPRKDGELVTSDDFAVALGWNHAQSATILQVALFWLLLLGIQLRVTYMGVAFLYEFVASSLLRRTVDSYTIGSLQAIYVLIFGATVSLSIAWLRPKAVPDYAGDSDRERIEERRQVIFHIRNAMALAVFSNASLLRLLRTAAAPLIRLKPRFRHNPKALTSASGPDGLRLNPHYPTIHLARSGRVVGMRSSRAGEWRNELAPINAIPAKARVSRASLSPTVEYYAKALLSANAAMDGLRLLLAGIKEDFAFKLKASIARVPGHKRRKPRRRHGQKARAPSQIASPTSTGDKATPVVSLRLYDMLAREAVLRRNSEILTELINFVTVSGLKEQMAPRLASWAEAKARMLAVK